MANGCTFDGAELADRQCRYPEDCPNGSACVQGFCQACNGINEGIKECSVDTNNGVVTNNGTNGQITNNGTITNNGANNNGSNNGVACVADLDCPIDLDTCALAGKTTCTDGVEGCDVTGAGTCECNPGDSIECGTSDVGKCTLGTKNCNETGAFDDCEGAIEPVTETCDGFDNNCDGATDEDCECAEDHICGIDTGECALGIQVCINGSLGTCEGAINSTQEVCDGLDNDCDGSTDEDLTILTNCGVGACEGNTGIETCVAGEYSGNTCNPFDGASNEICDGVDNDCDGQIDNGLNCECLNDTQQPCGSNVGECVMGIQTCVDGVWATCEGEVVPTTELCNSRDDDCNGGIDNNACVVSPDDTDGDGVANTSDNCVNIPNPGQENGDGGVSGNVCDGCNDDLRTEHIGGVVNGVPTGPSCAEPVGVCQNIDTCAPYRTGSPDYIDVDEASGLVSIKLSSGVCTNGVLVVVDKMGTEHRYLLPNNSSEFCVQVDPAILRNAASMRLELSNRDSVQSVPVTQ